MTSEPETYITAEVQAYIGTAESAACFSSGFGERDTAVCYGCLLA